MNQHQRACARLMMLLIAITLLAGCQTQPVATGISPLFDNLGNLHHPVTTESKLAQRYFDQGLTLAYGFNHPEAARSFRGAQVADPQCAMAYWGEAYVLGPNINKAMADDSVPRAYAAIQKAIALKGSATAKERALIDALAARYVATPVADRSALELAYMKAMQTVAAQHPDDADVQVLYAESIMNTMPWDYWLPGEPPVAKDQTKVLIATLENVIRKQPDHFGAIHFYIHAVEAGPTPEQAEKHADRLTGLCKGAGHLVHMPAHIYIRTGRYYDAVQVNVLASAADETYISQCRVQGFYPALYYSHNLHFLGYAASMAGMSEVSISAAKRTHGHLCCSPIAIAAPEMQVLKPVRIQTLVRFGKWDEVLTEEKPSTSAPYDLAAWHYAQGIALVRKGKADEAKPHAAALAQLHQSDGIKAMEIPAFPGQRVVEISSLVLHAELQWAAGDKPGAIETFTKAVAVQDSLPYMEPPWFYYPVRQSLGQALLDAGRAAEAEAVYREDLKQHRHNGWSLFGLMKSLEAQNKTDEAKLVEARFKEAWKHSDIKLTASRL